MEIPPKSLQQKTLGNSPSEIMKGVGLERPGPRSKDLPQLLLHVAPIFTLQDRRTPNHWYQYYLTSEEISSPHEQKISD